MVAATPAQIVCPGCGTLNRVPVERAADTARCGSCHRALFDAQPVEVDEAGLQRHVQANSVPVLLDVWAPWCGPCRIMGPEFARAAATLEPQLRLLKLNADTAQTTCAQLGVRGIPAMFLFQSGTVIAQTAGAMKADAIVRWVRGNLPSQ